MDCLPLSVSAKEPPFISHTQMTIRGASWVEESRKIISHLRATQFLLHNRRLGYKSFMEMDKG